MSSPAALTASWTGRWPAEATRCRAVLLTLVLPVGLVCQAAEGPPFPARSRIVDPAIQSAGGVGCTSCGPNGCRQPHGGPHGHQGGCRDGACVPYCPVRPQQFGFYGTQWRRWPGQEIVQVAAERDVAPVAPPRSAVPGPAEESINPQGDSDAAGDTGGGDSAASLAPPGEAPPEPRPLDPAPNAPPQPESVPEPIPEPAFEPAMEFGPEPAAPSPDPTARPAAEAQPDATEPVRPEPEKKPRPEDENLFEVLSGWRARRKFAVGPAGGSPVATVAADREGPRQAGHVEQPTVREVPRVPFDPAAETRRLRNAR